MEPIGRLESTSRPSKTTLGKTPTLKKKTSSSTPSLPGPGTAHGVPSPFVVESGHGTDLSPCLKTTRGRVLLTRSQRKVRDFNQKDVYSRLPKRCADWPRPPIPSVSS